MEKQTINKADISCNEDKSNLTLTIWLTKEQRDLFLIERGTQPKDMFKIEVKETLRLVRT